MEEAESFMDVRCPLQREVKTNLSHIISVPTCQTDIIHSHEVEA